MPNATKLRILYVDMKHEKLQRESKGTCKHKHIP